MSSYYYLFIVNCYCSFTQKWVDSFPGIPTTSNTSCLRTGSYITCVFLLFLSAPKVQPMNLTAKLSALQFYKNLLQFYKNEKKLHSALRPNTHKNSSKIAHFIERNERNGSSQTPILTIWASFLRRRRIDCLRKGLG